LDAFIVDGEDLALPHMDAADPEGSVFRHADRFRECRWFVPLLAMHRSTPRSTDT
jgi:hypothetical protein